MSNKTTNQTFKPRIFPAPALTELALCLTQLLHLEYDGELESGFGFIVCFFFFFFANSFHSSIFYQKLWESCNPSFPRGLLTPGGFLGYSKGLRNLKGLQFPYQILSFHMQYDRSKIDLQENTPAVSSPECSFQSCSFPILQARLLRCTVSQDNLKCSLRSICSLRHPKFPLPMRHTQGQNSPPEEISFQYLFYVCNTNYQKCNVYLGFINY